MVRIIVCLLLSLQMVSCCYRGKTTAYGWIRKEIIIPSRAGDSKLYSLIDTNFVYEQVSGFSRNSGHLPNDTSRGQTFLRFYSRGRVSKFPATNYIAPEGSYERKKYKQDSNPREITREDFDPNNSLMGYAYVKDVNVYLKLLVLNQCQATVNKTRLIINNDTLIEVYSDLKRETERYFYVKRKVPAELLAGWTPDW